MKNRKKPNIAILTWRLRNFGTALQSYALARWLENHDARVRMVKYNLPASNELVKLNPLTVRAFQKKIRNRIVGKFRSYKNKTFIDQYKSDFAKSYQRFENFYKQLPTEDVKPFKSNSNYYNDTYDCIVVGSDQVWSPKYLSETYFLDFVDDAKKVAYAPSLGVGQLTEPEAQFYADRLQRFEYISLREKSSARLLGLSDSVVVCDPTLLFTGDEWKCMLQLEPSIDDYIFVYTLSANPWYKNVLNKLTSLFNVNKIVVVTCPEGLSYYCKDGYEIRIDVGPKEWVELLYNARAVVTDSFHGVCFSVLFNKRFIALKRFGDNDKCSENSRVLDLMSELGLIDNLIQNGDEISAAMFEIAPGYQSQLGRFREKSIIYLTNIIDHYSNGN